MSEKKIRVPEEMLKAATDWAVGNPYYMEPGTDLRAACEKGCRGVLEAALRWLSENPIVPSEQDIRDMIGDKAELPVSAKVSSSHSYWTAYEWVRWGFFEWNRRMFLAPEPEVPTYEKLLDLWKKAKATGVWPDQCIDITIATREAIDHGQLDEAVKDLFWKDASGRATMNEQCEASDHNTAVLEAYRRGVQSERASR